MCIRDSCRTDRSSSLTLRFNAALSARAAASAFLIESTSPRNSLRTRRTISALSTDAMLGTRRLCQGQEEGQGQCCTGGSRPEPCRTSKSDRFLALKSARPLSLDDPSAKFVSPDQAPKSRRSKGQAGAISQVSRATMRQARHLKRPQEPGTRLRCGVLQADPPVKPSTPPTRPLRTRPRLVAHARSRVKSSTLRWLVPLPDRRPSSIFAFHNRLRPPKDPRS